MNLEELKARFGEEYPVALTTDGIRMPLHTERRFSRSYHSDDNKTGYEISRFMDGSASITATELKREWDNWAEGLRSDFCQSCCWLNEQSDFPEMLRFIMEHGCPQDWSGIALSVASHLPPDEAFGALVKALHNTRLGESSNIAQAIAATKHSDAETTLRKHLASLWTHPALWDDADFVNWVAFDATTCIAHLIELGAPTTDFTEQVRKLSEHVCSHNRQSCRNFLAKHFLWLTPSQE